MNTFVKSILALGVTTALSVSSAHAATYQVIDKGAASLVKFTYSQQENNNGQMAISGENFYNFPVQFEYLDESFYNGVVSHANQYHEITHELDNIQDEAALRAGTPVANDLAWVKSYLQRVQNNTISPRSQLRTQAVGDVSVLINNGSETQDVTIFDEKFAGTETYTRSTVDFVNGITNQGWIYGNASAPFLPVDFVDSNDNEITFWVREFDTRGFFSPDNGQTIIPLLPPEATYGGESAILDISENNIAVGYASTSIDQSSIDTIDNEEGGCADTDILADMPLSACIQQIRTKGLTIDLSAEFVNGSENTSIYNSEAYLWQLDETGQLSATALGHLVTPHEDDTREFKSFAQAVNSHGVAVGFAHGWVDENRTDIRNRETRSFYAVVYKDGQVTDFTDDHSVEYNSRAYDINDDGIAVGHVTKYINGDARTKFYYVDTNETEMKMVQPNDFFPGSSSTARAINEAGKIVGDGEVETHNDSSNTPRRRHAFLYDKNTDVFTDLNDFLPCNSAYTIIAARDINDNDEISASAVVKVERRDAKGELMYDADGTALTEDVIRAVTLKPISGEVEDCSEVEEKIERQGAHIGLFSLAVLCLVGIRRRFK